MIELTKEETLEILKALSRLEGALIAEKANNDIINLLGYPVEILSNKITKKAGDFDYMLNKNMVCESFET